MALSNPILSATLNHISLEQIKARKGPPPWSHPVTLADHVTGVVIHQDETAANDNHCHTYDEWWVVLEGEKLEVNENKTAKLRSSAGGKNG